MSAVPGPLFVKPQRRVLIAWAMLATLNLGAGIVLSFSPQRLTDLDTMMGWGSQWLAGIDVYHLPGSYVDYPPNAIVLLSPLGLVPVNVVAPLWALFNVALAGGAAYFAARFFRPHDPFRVIALPILMFLCWGGVRTLTQFSMAALAASMAALLLADRQPWRSGAWLGVAMMKPHVALPVFLWAAFTRRWHVFAVSTALAAALVIVFAARIGESPASVLLANANALAVYHTGDAILSGLSELRPLIWQLSTDKSEVDAIAAAIAAGLIAAIGVAGFQEGRGKPRVIYAAPALVACWCLLTFRHLTYGFIVMLPVLMMLALNDAEPSRLRKALLWLLQGGMMLDVPGLTRRLGLAETAIAQNVLIHTDRALFLTLFVGLVVLAWREPPGAST